MMRAHNSNRHLSLINCQLIGHQFFKVNHLLSDPWDFFDLLSFPNTLLKVIIYSSCPLLLTDLKEHHHLILALLGEIKIGIIAPHHPFVLQ
jgi:hypothetical protein